MNIAFPVNTLLTHHYNTQGSCHFACSLTSFSL